MSVLIVIAALNSINATVFVSPNYDKGDGKPMRQQTIRVDNTDHIVFGWVVPPRAPPQR